MAVARSTWHASVPYDLVLMWMVLAQKGLLREAISVAYLKCS